MLYDTYTYTLFWLTSSDQTRHYTNKICKDTCWPYIYSPVQNNCVPYYGKCCHGCVNGNKLPPDERLKATEQMTVPRVPPKEGEVHVSRLWLHSVPWATRGLAQEEADLLSPLQLYLWVSTLIACEQIVKMYAAATTGWHTSPHTHSHAHIIRKSCYGIAYSVIDESYETRLCPGEIFLFPAHNLKTSLIPTICTKISS